MLPAHAAPSGQATLSARTTLSAPAANSPGWRITDRLPSGVHVSSVVATSPTNAWALGCCSNRIAKDGILVWHWNGARWLPVSVPAGPPRQADLATLAASPDGSAWVLGMTGGPESSQTFSLHWTGHGWAAIIDATWQADPTSAVVAPDAHDVWAFGWADASPPITAHFNGRTWSSVQLPVYVAQASALSASDIWAVGSDGSPENGTVVRWNGASWTAVKLPVLHLPAGDVLGQLGQVSAVTADNVWIAAELQSGNIESLESGILLLHWNGRGWQQLTPPRGLITGQFDGVNMSVDSSGGLWLTTAPWIGSKVVVLHYSDGQWRRAAAPAGLSSVAQIPGTASAWGTATDGIAKYGP